jgi:hypothetical protein
VLAHGAGWGAQLPLSVGQSSLVRVTPLVSLSMLVQRWLMVHPQGLPDSVTVSLATGAWSRIVRRSSMLVSSRTSYASPSTPSAEGHVLAPLHRARARRCDHSPQESRKFITALPVTLRVRVCRGLTTRIRLIDGKFQSAGMLSEPHLNGRSAPRTALQDRPGRACRTDHSAHRP